YRLHPAEGSSRELDRLRALLLLRPGSADAHAHVRVAAAGERVEHAARAFADPERRVPDARHGDGWRLLPLDAADLVSMLRLLAIGFGLRLLFVALPLLPLRAAGPV